MGLTVKCPVCRAEVPWEGNPHRPFCSERCQMVDLGTWVEEKYRIPGKGKQEKMKEDDGEDEEHS